MELDVAGFSMHSFTLMWQDVCPCPQPKTQTKSTTHTQTHTHDYTLPYIAYPSVEKIHGDI